MRPFLFALVCLLALPGTAAAAEVSLRLEVRDVQFGSTHVAGGRLTESDAPLPGRRVELRRRAYPFRGAYRTVARARTDARGRFRFEERFSRNVRLRVVAPTRDVQSRVVSAYVFPRPSSSFEPVGRNRLRITQILRTPPQVRLSAPTSFYLGPRGATVGRRVALARPRRLSPGRYRARATVALPPAWNDRFRFASCFRYSPGSGLGDPRASCRPRQRF